mmetsp:Transcript_28933/g.74826  ORF Transcript_28933/g.74826 Transcript_28933/m.74826 type:complete len:102 (+) Transcript_28933:363-668(+)
MQPTQNACALLFRSPLIAQGTSTIHRSLRRAGEQHFKQERHNKAHSSSVQLLCVAVGSLINYSPTWLAFLCLNMCHPNQYHRFTSFFTDAGTRLCPCIHKC